MATEAFLDASYAIALASLADQNHSRAVALARRIQAERMRLITTRAVVLEIGNALSKPRYRTAAVKLLYALEHDPSVEVVPLSEVLFDKGFELYRQRPDKEWGLTDCVCAHAGAWRHGSTHGRHPLSAGGLPCPTLGGLIVRVDVGCHESTFIHRGVKANEMTVGHKRSVAQYKR